MRCNVTYTSINLIFLNFKEKSHNEIALNTDQTGKILSLLIPVWARMSRHRNVADWVVGKQALWWSPVCEKFTIKAQEETGKEKLLRHRPDKALMGRSRVTVAHQSGPTVIRNGPLYCSTPSHSPRIQAVPGRAGPRTETALRWRQALQELSWSASLPGRRVCAGHLQVCHGNKHALLKVL